MTSIHRIKIIALVSVMTILVSALSAVGAYMYFNAPPSTMPEGLTDDGVLYFEVHRGETAMSVGRRLEDEGVIRDRRFWRIVSRLEENPIRAGSYSLQFPATQREIYAALLVGSAPVQHRITIPEGVTLRRIAQILESGGICNSEDFLNAARDREILDSFNIPGESMEGFLFPDTYLFPANFPANRVVRAMAENFFRRIADLGIDAEALTPDELFQKVTLASIVEREYRIADEAAVMAGVFINRLNIRMPLQSCATVQYVITEILGKPHPRVILYRDTQIQNPFNTYIVQGLPPGPISAPGAVALNAVFNPVQSDYLFFRLVDGAAGRHYFSRTYDDHIQAGLLYVKRSS